MSETIAKPVSTTRNATVVGTLSALMPQLAKLIYPLGDSSATDYAQRQIMQEFISAGLIFLVPFVVYLLALFTSRYISTPEEMDEKRRLKHDFNELKNTLDDANKNPHRYSSKEIEEFQKDFADIRKRLASIGRKFLRNT